MLRAPVRRSRRANPGPAGYDRFSAFGALFASLDPEATAALLKRFVPLMETAYGELGVGSPDVLVRVRQAIDVVLTSHNRDQKAPSA